MVGSQSRVTDHSDAHGKGDASRKSNAEEGHGFAAAEDDVAHYNSHFRLLPFDAEHKQGFTPG